FTSGLSPSALETVIFDSPASLARSAIVGPAECSLPLPCFLLVRLNARSSRVRFGLMPGLIQCGHLGQGLHAAPGQALSRRQRRPGRARVLPYFRTRMI